jgi:kinesin family member 23
LKTENAAVTATLNQERERLKAFESKLIRCETTIDGLNRKLRDREDYITQIEQTLSEKQHLIARKEHEKEKQRRKFDSKMAEETDKKKREMQNKLEEQERNYKNRMRTQEEKLRLLTDIVNDVPSQPVSNLINRFNANCENAQVPSSERKARPRVNI